MDLSNFAVKLEFNIEKIAPIKYQEKWIKFKNNIQMADITTEDRNNLLLSVKNYCKLEINKNLPILDRTQIFMINSCVFILI